MKQTAQLLSVLFHPLFIPLFMMALTLFLPHTVFERYSLTLKLYLISYTFLLDVVLPLISLLLMKHYGLISSLKIEKREERQRPYLLMFFIYTLSAGSFLTLPVTHPLLPFAFVVSATLLLASMVVNRFMKVSAHAAGTTAAAVWVFILFEVTGLNLSGVLMVAILVAGLVMSARLYLQVHTSAEVVAGLALGLFIPLFLFSLLF